MLSRVNKIRVVAKKHCGVLSDGKSTGHDRILLRGMVATNFNVNNCHTNDANSAAHLCDRDPHRPAPPSLPRSRE